MLENTLGEDVEAELIVGFGLRAHCTTKHFGASDGEHAIESAKWRGYLPCPHNEGLWFYNGDGTQPELESHVVADGAHVT